MKHPTPVLPFYPPPAHHNAPAGTSKPAAESMAKPAAELRGRVLAFIAGEGEHGATDEQIAAELGMHSNTARPRRWELEKMGLIRDSGQRRKTASGRNAAVWVAA